MEISIKDIAEKLTISVSTVSRALNGNYGVSPKTREKVIQAAKEMGYVPNLSAKELVNRKSRLVGLIIPETDFEARPPFFELLPYCSKTLKEYGKETMISSISPAKIKENELDYLFRSRNLEGCIIMPGFPTGHPIYEQATQTSLPVLVMEMDCLGEKCSNIGPSEIDGAFMATRHLIENGHRKIGLINGFPSKIARERLIGYKKALQESGLPFDEQLVIESDFTGKGGDISIQQLLAQAPAISAVFFANDLMAMGAISRLSKMGIQVPRDLSVMGYDDFFVGKYFNPPLSSINLNYAQYGIRTAEVLMDLINEGTGKSVKMDPLLVERESVKQI